MAIYRMQTSSISRADDRSAVGAAAYRAGERLRDERTGELYNYARRRDVSHAEIFWPPQLEGRAPTWAADRAALWNAAEGAEVRRNSRVAREYLVSLPAELAPAGRLELARGFARELADRHRVAVDLAVHGPRPESDPRHHHAHLLVTTREVTATGLAAKAGLDMATAERQRLGLQGSIEELKLIRERWAVLANEALKSAGLSVRIDHRSLAAQGIDREPLPYIPIGAYHQERRGGHSELAERIRGRYRERVRAREHSAQRAASGPGPSSEPAVPAATLEQVRLQARQAWLQLRQGVEATAAPKGASRERSAVPDSPALTTPTLDRDRAL